MAESMDWVALKGIMAAQIVLATDCTQAAAVLMVDEHVKRNSGRINMEPADVCSMILVCVAEARAVPGPGNGEDGMSCPQWDDDKNDRCGSVLYPAEEHPRGRVWRCRDCTYNIIRIERED